MGPEVDERAETAPHGPQEAHGEGLKWSELRQAHVFRHRKRMGPGAHGPKDSRSPLSVILGRFWSTLAPDPVAKFGPVSSRKVAAACGDPNFVGLTGVST